jgi:hypothetical protein
LAAIQLFKIAGEGDPVNRIVPASMALLGALLLIGQHWSVVIAFDALGVSLVIQMLVLQRGRASGNPTGPAANIMANRQPEPLVTGIQVVSD